MKTFIIEQKITALANQYRIFGTNTAGEKKQLLCFAHQKRFAFKEAVEFFEDEERTRLAFKVKAEKVMDIHGKFVVTDAKGTILGKVRKAFKSSLLRSTWEILDSDDKVQLIVQERSQNIAIIRRAWAWVPYLGDIPFFIKYHFDFLQYDTKELLAAYFKTTRFRDHYKLKIYDEQLTKKVGWQTLITQAVLLDALQGR